MNKIFSKKSLAVLLTVLMLFSMIPAFSVTVSAASHTPITGVSVTTSNTSSENLADGVLTVTAKGSLFSKKTATVTVVNDTGTTAQLSFDYSTSAANSFTLAGASAAASGSYSGMLEANGSVVLKVTSNSGLSNLTATLKLSNFNIIEAKASSNVTFNYDSNYGSVTVDGTAVANGDVKEINMSGATLVATATNGGTFLGWVEADGSILSTAASYTIKPAADTTVKAIFVGADSAPHFSVGAAAQKSQSSGLLGFSKLYYYQVGKSYIFDNLNDAVSFAASDSSNKTLVLLNSATLPAGDYTIPAGVTLLIPFDTANTMYTTQAVGMETPSGYVHNPQKFRELTMAEGANLTINGSVSLSAKHLYAQGSKANGGSPTGNVSFIKMNEGSNITVNNGGALYTYGFIYGSGTLTVNNGGIVYENFQIMDFRGGTQSTDMDNGVFPISQYYVQNIEVPMTIYSGATEYAYTTVFMSSADFGSAVAFISKSNAMFNLTSGYVVKKYDGATDRLIVESYGDITVSPINMEIGTSSINSKNYELPINSNLTFTAKSGTITMGQDIALLPGAELNVDAGAKCVLNSGVSVYVYDADDWGDYTFGEGSTNSKFKPITYAPGKTYTRTLADLKDAQVRIDGIADASKGAVYTTAGGANIFSTGTGKIISAPGSQKVTHQIVQGGGACKLSDGTAVSASYYVEIPLTNAKLQNADGTITQIGNTPGTYTSTDGIWNKTVCEHSYKETITTPAACGVEGLKTFTCLDTTNCGYSYTEVIPALEHTEAVIEAVAPTCTNPGLTEGKTCSVCGKILVAQQEVAATGHKYEAVVTAPTCTEAGYTTYTCAGCGDSYVADEVDALGHLEAEAVEENRVEATCVTPGSYEMVIYCSRCNAELSRETFSLVATGHTEAEAVVENEKAADCVNKGSYESVVYCAVCGEELSRETVVTSEALGHKYEAVVTAPTCTEAGYTTYTCAGCGDSYVADEVDALGHTAGETVIENVVNSTCTAEGSYDNVVYCTVCGEEISRETNSINMASHIAGNVAVENFVEATCTTEGSYDNVTYCRNCNIEMSRQTVVTEKTSHMADSAVVENIVAATCTTEGSYDNVIYCRNCDEELGRETIVLEKAAHQQGSAVVENIVAATCTADGSYDNVTYCITCNEEMSRETITVAKIPHTYDKEITAPTCEAEGYTTYTCSCGDSYKAEYVTALGHDYVAEQTKAPTCAETGVMTYTCKNDASHTYTEEIAVISHTYGESVVENIVNSTCTQAGSYDNVVYCTVCNAEISRETLEIAKAAHISGTTVAENIVASTCTQAGSYDNVTYCRVCNEEMSRVTVETAKADHTAGTTAVENIVEASCTVEGSYDNVTYCRNCNEEMSRVTVATAKADHFAGTTAVENIVASTCTQAGSYDNVTYCRYCNVEMSRATVEIAKADHIAGTTAVENIVDSTCTQDGSYDNVTFCRDCNEEMNRVTVAIPATGHNEVTDAAVEPTYDSTGLTEGSHCSVCGEVIVAQETIPALEYILGDADHNDEINILDLIALKKALLDEEEYTVVVDMDKNATVDSLDLVALKVYLWDNF